MKLSLYINANGKSKALSYEPSVFIKTVRLDVRTQDPVPLNIPYFSIINSNDIFYLFNINDSDAMHTGSLFLSNGGFNAIYIYYNFNYLIKINIIN